MAGSTYGYTTKAGRRKWGWCLDLGMRYDEEKRCNVRQQLRRQGFDRRLDAEQAMRKEQHQIDIGTAPGLSERQVTVAQWCDTWIESADIRPSTQAGYEQIVKTYIKPPLGYMVLGQLRADHIAKLLAAIRDGKVRPKRNHRGDDGRLKASTIRQIHAVVTIMLGAAVEQHLIPHNPAAGVKVKKQDRDKPAWNPDDDGEHDKLTWGVAEADSFVAFTGEQEPRLAIAFRASLAYGLRRGELAALRWQDVDTEGGWLHVRQNLSVAGAELVFGPPKTDAGKRTVPLSLDPGFAAALREHRMRQLADRLAAGPAWEDTGLVLAGPRGELVKPWRLSTRFRELVTEAGLPSITLHGCRRSANSTWAAAGVDLGVRKAWGGWSEPSMADGVYLRIRPEVHEAAAQRVAAYKAEYGPASAAR